MQFGDVPFILHYFRVGSSWQLTVGFSHFWTLVDYGCYSALIILFAWATIERHILIFHDRWIATKKRRLLVHYLPLVIILTYCFIYYLTVVVFLSCPWINYQSPVNGVPSPCLYDNVFFVTWDLVCHQLIPTCIIVIFSIGLFVRVLHQKCRLQQAIQWRKQRKMASQVLCITVLFQVFNFPWAFLQFCYIINLSIDPGMNAFIVAYYLPYYLISFFPFICCGTLPELRKKLGKLLFCQRRHHTIGPAVINEHHPS